MAKASKYRVRSTRDLLGYIYAHTEHEAWTKAKARFGVMLVCTVEMM
jgi:hypothetical protein